MKQYIFIHKLYLLMFGLMKVKKVNPLGFYLVLHTAIKDTLIKKEENTFNF